MRSVGFERLMAEVQRVYAEPVRRQKTWKKINQVLREMNAVGLTSAEKISPGLIARWIDAHPERKPTTAYSLLRSFRAVCSLAKSLGWIDTDPFDWRKPAAWLPLDLADDDERPQRSHSAESMRRLFGLLDKEAAEGGWKEHRLKALIYTYAYTGLRKNEALQLHRDDIDLIGRTLKVRGRTGRRLKTRASRRVLAMPPDLADVLRGWMARCGSEWVFPGVTRKGPWTGGPPGHKPLDVVKAAGRRAGIDNLTILDFRHTLATLADEWGMGQLELMRWLGHTRPSTQAYYRKAPDLAGLAATADKIRFKGGA